MIPKLIFSQSLERLAERLMEELDAEQADPLETRTILIPNHQIKQWLLLEIAKKKGIAMGLQMIEPMQLFPPATSALEMFCRIYSALEESQNEQVIAYLEGKKKRKMELAGQLSRLFTRYTQYDLEGSSWQIELFRKVVKQQVWEVNEPIICFGIDYLPPLFWEKLLKAPRLSCYFFSPCASFWEDACSDWERQKLDVACDAPRLLGNWGRLARKTLRMFEYTDTEELYVEPLSTRALGQLQRHLLQFQETKDILADDSIRVVGCGASLEREIEFVREEILRLNVPYHEVSVLAPDIEPYIPWIEYVFGKEIPYRIAGAQIVQSAFRQGLLHLMNLGRWDIDSVLALFETPSFYRKQGWDADMLEVFRKWTVGNVHWGRDSVHRKAHLEEILGPQEFLDVGSWEKGLDQLLEALIFLTPKQVNPDLFEELLRALDLLKTLDLQGEKTLSEWANCLEKAADLCLKVDPDDETDQTMHNHFQALLREMRQSSLDTAYPSEVVQTFLFRPCQGQIHAAELHAVRFSSIEKGALLPAKAVFLIGMDEMSFPKMSIPSSLDLLKGKIPDRAEEDRYLFLEALFAPSESLRISYRHLSPDEGKQVNPSLLVQELMGALQGLKPQIFKAKSYPEIKKHLRFPSFTETALPKGAKQIAVQDLKQLARHPWRFFLKKVQQIQIDEDLEASFALQRGKLVKALSQEEIIKEELPSPFQKALHQQAWEKIVERKAQLEEWQIQPFTLVLKEQCQEKQWEGNRLIVPALLLQCEDCTIQLVGEIQNVSLQGIISSKDQIADTLKIWPEALVVAMALNAPQILFLESGKQKTIQNPQEALQAFIVYYFHNLVAPSPLLPQWADSLLRQMKTKCLYEDPVMDWVLARSATPLNEMQEVWRPFLKKTFFELIALYPSRGAHAHV